MNICIITEYYPYKGEITGGVESRVWNVSLELSKRHNVSVICTRQPGQPSTEEYNNLKVYRVGPVTEYTNNISIIKRSLFVIAAIKKSMFINFEIIEGSSFLSYIPSGVAGMIKRKPMVVTYHELWADKWVQIKGVLGMFGEIWESIVLLFPWSRIISVSEYTKNKLSRIGVNNVTSIPNGIFPISSSQFSVYGKRIKAEVVCVSRLTRQKDIDTLIRAISIIKNEHPRIHCTIIGQGEERKNLEESSKILGLQKNITFLGYVEDKKIVEKCISKAKIFCSPSTLEGFGITVLESYARGTPAVLTSIPAYKEITEDNGALFFNPGNAEECAQQIKKLILNNKTWKKLSIEALKQSKKYHWKRIVKEIEKVYEEVISALS